MELAPNELERRTLEELEFWLCRVTPFRIEGNRVVDGNGSPTGLCAVHSATYNHAEVTAGLQMELNQAKARIADLETALRMQCEAHERTADTLSREGQEKHETIALLLAKVAALIGSAPAYEQCGRCQQEQCGTCKGCKVLNQWEAAKAMPESIDKGKERP